MKKIKNIFWMILMALGISACDTINEFPGDHPVDPTIVNVNLAFAFNMEMTPFAGTEGLNRSESGTHDTRCIVDIYREGVDTLVARQVQTFPGIVRETTSVNARFSLHAARYKAVAWVDYVELGRETDKYYSTADLSFVKIADPYEGDNDYKDAFSGTADIDLTGYRDNWNVNMDVPIALERPFARIEVISTDIDKYLDKVGEENNRSVSKRFTVEFSYSCYFPCGYNVLTGKPNDSRTDVAFRCVSKEAVGNEICLGCDYVFVNGTESGVTVDMAIYNEEGVLVNEVSGVTIPVKRGKLTSIKGEFLTRGYHSGVGIDPDYEGEIVVEIPD